MYLDYPGEHVAPAFRFLPYKARSIGPAVVAHVETEGLYGLVIYCGKEVFQHFVIGAVIILQKVGDMTEGGFLKTSFGKLFTHIRKTS